MKTKNKVKLKHAYIDCGVFLMDNNKLPERGGTGNFGKIKKGNTFDVKLPNPNNPVTIGGIEFNDGCTIRAKVKNPGQDVDNWRVYY